jgi:hypothetical protein
VFPTFYDSRFIADSHAEHPHQTHPQSGYGRDLGIDTMEYIGIDSMHAMGIDYIDSI